MERHLTPKTQSFQVWFHCFYSFPWSRLWS